jgi:hypothetical protein
MASLTDVSPGSSYPGLLKTNDNTALTTTPQRVTDGCGNCAGLLISTKDVANRGAGNIQCNTAFGENALINKVSGGDNVAIGFNAMTLNQTGSMNVGNGVAQKILLA